MKLRSILFILISFLFSSYSFATGDITLPDARTIKNKINNLSIHDHYKENIIPKIQKHAGQKKVAMAIVLMMELANADYCSGLPPFMTMLTPMNIPPIIEVLTEENIELQQEALQLFKQIHEK